MGALMQVSVAVIVSLQLMSYCTGFLQDRLELRPNVHPASPQQHCPVHPDPIPLPSPLPDAIMTAFDNLGSLLADTVNKTSLPGIAASVVYRDQVLWSKGFGVKEKTKLDVPPDGTSIFRIASISKVFAALMVYQLYDRGMINSIDDPLNKYCSAFQMKNPYGTSNITLRQMMAQMAGLPREAPCEWGTINSNCSVTTEEVLARLKNQSLIFPPWSRPSYSNLAFALIGRCLADYFNPQLKMTYEEYVQKNILDPLQMKNTGFQYTSSVKSKMAVGYNPDGSVAPLVDLAWAGPAGQMYSTTDDLNKFAEFFYSAAGNNVSKVRAMNVLSPVLRREMMLQVFINGDQRSGFGTPWEILFGSNYTILRKGGNINGYSALFSFVPKLKLGLNVLLTGDFYEFDISNTAYPIIIPAFVSTLMLHQPLYPFPPDPEVYVGDYVPVTPAMNDTVSITEYNKQLKITSSDLFISGMSGYLAYREPLMLQVEYPDYLHACLFGEGIGETHEWLVFEPKDQSGVSPSFTIPGLYYGLVFKRQG